MLKTTLSGLTLVALVAAMIGAATPPAAALTTPALPALQAQTGPHLAYWHHRRHHRRHPHGGLTIRL